MDSLSKLIIDNESSKLLSLLEEMINKSEEISFYTETKAGDFYLFNAKPNFLAHLAATKISITLDSKFDIIGGSCGCLAFSKNHVCIHTIIFYAVVLKKYDKEKYKKQMEEVQAYFETRKNSLAIKKLNEDLKKNNLFYNTIRILPVIEDTENGYELSLKIGYDKYYVVKNVNDFIDNTNEQKKALYGKKLAFVHSFECFDSISKDFYSYLENIKSDTDLKDIKIKKSHVLRIFEMYRNENIFFKSKYDDKALERKLIEIKNINIVLDSKRLFVDAAGCKNLLTGVNYAYFIDDSHIYFYKYKTSIENKLLNTLFLVDGSLSIESLGNEFISTLYPLIKNSIIVKEDFYDKFPIPNININTYLTYEENQINLKYEIDGDNDSPYLKQQLEDYLYFALGYGFTKNDENYVISSIDDQYKFLISDLSNLKSFGDVYFDESMNKLKPKKSGKTSIKISYNVGILDFKLENARLSIEDIKQMLIAYHQKKKFVKLNDDSILEIDEKDTKELDDFLKDFNISIDDLGKPIHKQLSYILKVLDEEENVLFDDEPKKIFDNIKNYKNSNLLPNDKFASNLRSYQLEGFRWLKTLASYSLGGILADDMGLGKTIQVLSLIDSDESELPSLIVCPMSLVYNWENECSKWNINKNCVVINGLFPEREKVINSITNNTIYVTSYDSLRRDIALYKNKFRFVIADEAQIIKNQYTLKSEAIKSVQAEVLFALTGTPIENGLSDLWNIFDFIMPGYLSNYQTFRNRYEDLIMHDDYEALDKLKARVMPFILRRNKKDVLDLGDKIEDYIYCKMGSEQKKLYDVYIEKLREDLKSGGDNILSLITRLRQICITPELIFKERFEDTKIAVTLDLLKSQIGAGHRILLFSQFANVFPIISKELEKENISYFVLDGKTKSKDRIDMVDEFNANENIKVFLISLKAGGMGLNLVGADMVIHLDPWWNSSVQNQATDRAYRIGQTKDVYVVKLICKDTIEEKVVKLQELKSKLADSVVTDKLTHKEVLELIS